RPEPGASARGRPGIHLRSRRVHVIAMPRDKARKIKYDCSKCPGYCCSYPRIEVSDKDLARLARHFELAVDEAERRFTRRYRDDESDERILRHRKDEI